MWCVFEDLTHPTCSILPIRMRSPMVSPPVTPAYPVRVGAIVGPSVLASLIGLTFVNATSSRPLAEALGAEARGDYPAASRAAIEHLDRRPWSREASRVVARCLSRLDHAEEAEPYYRRAGSLTRDDLRYRAYGLTRANLRERALEAFDQVLRLEPDDVGTLRLKAGLLLSMTRWGDVLEIGQRLAASRAGSVEVDAPVATAGHWTFKPMVVASVGVLGTTLEALAYHNQGEVEDAVSTYEKILASDPDLRAMPLDPRLFWSQFCEDLLSMGRAPDVIRRLGLADPGRNDPGLTALLARAQMQQGAIDEAEAAWRRVLELNQDHPAAWLNLGRIESGRGHTEEAARLLTRAATLAPESVDAAYNLGLTYRRLSRSAEAEQWERQASRLRLRKEAKAGGISTGQLPSTPSS